MKKAFPFLLILLCPFIVFANGFIIKGHIEGLQTGAVSLAYLNNSGDDTTITSPITGGNFTLTGQIPEPELATLTISEDRSFNLIFFLENKAISIQLIKDAPEKTIVTGSPSNITYQKLKPGLNDFFAHTRENKEAHEQALTTHNTQALQNADSLWVTRQYAWLQTIRSSITEQPENYAALFFIKWSLLKTDNMDAVFSVFMQLSPTVRQSSAGKKFISEFEHLHKISPGIPAPEITGRDTSGQPVKLASLKGKVILLDFWASYCGPCRQENKKMLPVYEKYHSAGFEIISFSLDNERPLWVSAIQSDGLPWEQVSELRGGAGATSGIYDITDLPRNVLIDRTGKIYAKDLHGEELINAVEGLLRKEK